MYGSKNWRVYQNPAELLPANDWPKKKVQKHLKKRKSNRQYLINAVLKQGDALYIPRGYIHDADCKDLQDDSIHVSVGFFPPLMVDLIYYGFKSLSKNDNNKVQFMNNFNMTYVETVLLKVLTSKPSKASLNDVAAVRSSPSLPFAINDNNVMLLTYNQSQHKELLDRLITI